MRTNGNEFVAPRASMLGSATVAGAIAATSERGAVGRLLATCSRIAREVARLLVVGGGASRAATILDGAFKDALRSTTGRASSSYQGIGSVKELPIVRAEREERAASPTAPRCVLMSRSAKPSARIPIARTGPAKRETKAAAPRSTEETVLGTNTDGALRFVIVFLPGARCSAATRPAI
jgi:hypothetical protein